ncbi:PqqD family protein [Sphingomonas sp. HDW15A]|uniref:PqqD family protein n=1 Tax=Sphingomonas sp. HDW15A TaxID=2714942 RepID=UPI00140AA84B|nr:PqqD family protein [Sphingomonas sp. HDW15A]QIK95822.1 PqqD family protein [Sphingomonas sp. HDW15A]
MTYLSKMADRLTEAEIDDEIVVMRTDTGEFYSLTGTAAAIWRLIDGTRDRAAVTCALSDEFNGQKASISREVNEFVSELEELGLITHS